VRPATKRAIYRAEAYTSRAGLPASPRVGSLGAIGSFGEKSHGELNVSFRGPRANAVRSCDFATHSMSASGWNFAAAVDYFVLPI
jgi:hypothetical protein